MKQKSAIRPSRLVSTGSLIGLVFMIMFGLGFAVLVGSVLHEEEAPLVMAIVFYIFMTGWLGTAIFMLVYHFLNIKRAKGISLIDIETESSAQDNQAAHDPIDRLRSLEKLKLDGLISEEEFKSKREEIMQQKW